MEKIKCSIRILSHFKLMKIEKNNEFQNFEYRALPYLNTLTDAHEPKLRQLRKIGDGRQIHDKTTPLKRRHPSQLMHMPPKRHLSALHGEQPNHRSDPTKHKMVNRGLAELKYLPVNA